MVILSNATLVPLMHARPQKTIGIAALARNEMTSIGPKLDSCVNSRPKRRPLCEREIILIEDIQRTVESRPKKRSEKEARAID